MTEGESLDREKKEGEGERREKAQVLSSAQTSASGSTLDDSDRSQLNTLCTDASCMTRINDIRYILV